MFRMSGESIEHRTVLGKTDFDKALEEGWTPTENLPYIEFPKTLYRADGSTKIVSTKAEAVALIKLGWEEKRYPAPKALPEIWELAPAEAGSPEAQAALSRTANQNVELSLKLMESNQRQADQAAQIDELKRQNAEILELLKSGNSAKAKPKAE